MLFLEHLTFTKTIAERNKEICRMYRDEDLNTYEIGQIFKITHQRVSQILKENVALLKRDLEWEKAKRINKLSRWIEEHPKTKKDAAELLIQLKEEMEGVKGVNFNPVTNVHVHKERVVVFRDIKDDTNGTDLSPDVYARQSAEGNKG